MGRHLGRLVVKPLVRHKGLTSAPRAPEVEVSHKAGQVWTWQRILAPLIYLLAKLSAWELQCWENHSMEHLFTQEELVIQFHFSIWFLRDDVGGWEQGHYVRDDLFQCEHFCGWLGTALLVWISLSVVPIQNLIRQYIFTHRIPLTCSSLCSFKNCFIEIQLKHHKIHQFELYNSMVCTTLQRWATV